MLVLCTTSAAAATKRDPARELVAHQHATLSIHLQRAGVFIRHIAGHR
jgi:hypothetical protein